MIKKIKGIWQSNLPQALGGIVLLVLVIAGLYFIYSLFSENRLIKAERVELIDQVKNLKAERQSLLDKVAEQANTIDSFDGTIKKIGATVGDLEKLSKTDEELLMKYSKVYFLNENYTPAELLQLDSEITFNKSVDYYLHAGVVPHLERMVRNAEREDINLLVASAYRSFGTQSQLKSTYRITYGSGANRFSADQGYSEHQLGTTVDLTTSKVGGVSDAFEKDPAFRWLQENAHEYGFILSYPKYNTYYKFEPWHWRYVGIELATKLHEEGKYFYDMDQREIDTYLINVF